MRRRPLPLAVLAATTVAVVACAPQESDDTAASGSPAGGEACSPGELETLEPDTLTIATDEPAYEPWFVDDEPANGEGFESAVAYAVAAELGYTEDQVTWTRVPFNAAIQPGPQAVRLRHQPVLHHRGAQAGGRLLLAVLHVSQAVDHHRGLGRRRSDDHRRPQGAADRRPGRHHEPRRARPRSSPPTPTRWCSTATTTPSSRCRTARWTRSSSTCRPPSTSPRPSSTTA